jgi:hypothetical protein
MHLVHFTEALIWDSWPQQESLCLEFLCQPPKMDRYDAIGLKYFILGILYPSRPFLYSLLYYRSFSADYPKTLYNTEYPKFYPPWRERKKI